MELRECWRLTMNGLMAVLLVAAMAWPAGAQGMKVGYVDLQRALNESEAGKKAKDEFKAEMEKLRLELKKRQEELENLRQRIEKKALVLKQQERRKLEKDYQRRVRDFERAYKDSQAELQAKDDELTEGILRELHAVITELGKQEGYLLILEAGNNAVLFGAKSADMTDKVIAEYDRSHRQRPRRD